MATTHRTASGYVELLHSWGHGKGGDGLSFHGRPATLITDDDDGHYSAWKVTGTMRDAAVTLGRFIIGSNGTHVAVFDGSWVRAESTPDDFWIEDRAKGEFIPNLTAHPNVVAF